MYKVLKEVVEDNQKGTKNETSVPYLYICLAIKLIDVVFLNMFFFLKKHWQSKASVSGRVRDAGAKGLLAKQLQGLELPAFLDMATGAIKVKKAKKVKTPEEESMAELKKLVKKWFA